MGYSHELVMTLTCPICFSEGAVARAMHRLVPPPEFTEVRMRRYRFFEEFIDERLENSSGNVIAIDIGGGSFVQEGGVCFAALCPIPDRAAPNSPVLKRLFNAEYLGARCRCISEAQARTIHPKLFEYLDRMA